MATICVRGDASKNDERQELITCKERSSVG